MAVTGAEGLGSRSPLHCEALAGPSALDLGTSLRRDLGVVFLEEATAPRMTALADFDTPPRRCVHVRLPPSAGDHHASG